MINPLEFFLLVFSYIGSIGGFLLSLWWVYLPVFLFFLARGLWLKHKRQEYIQKMEWILLEVVPPREVKKTPKAMEQFFAGLHGAQGKPNWRERNVLGEVQTWFSLEIVSQSGDIHFFIRTLKKYRDLVEANVYAQYPEAEIHQVDDYVNSVPADAPNQECDLGGMEFVLTKEDAYPIRTYPAFERDIVLEEQRIDPVASLLEVMSKLEEKEQIWIQMLVRPVADDWKKDGEKLRDKLVGRKIEKSEGELKKEAVAWKDAGKGVAHQLITGESLESTAEKEKTETPFLWKSTKAEQEVIHAIENNIAKIGFEVIVRFIYLGPPEIFKVPNIHAVIGCLKQFNTQDLNGFKPNGKVATKVDYRIKLKGPREYYRKKKIIADYRKRYFVQQSAVIDYLKPFFFEHLPVLNWFFVRSKPFVFNIEELATVYHLPGMMVKTPLVPKVEAKKAEPPAGLPVG